MASENLVKSPIIGKGEMGRLIRDYDWESTSLGPVSSWPGSLVTATNFLLQSPVPIVMLWGRDGVMIYNDAYSEFAGGRHPQLLGSKVVEGWPEVAEFNQHVMDKGLKGETLEYRDQRLVLHRNGKPEDVSMDLTYSPVIDESGKPGGVLAIVFETTMRVQAERLQRAAEDKLRAERERLRSLFMQAPAAIAVLRGSEHRFELANPLYMKLIGKRSVIGKTVRETLPEVIDQGFTDILDGVYAEAKPYYGNEVPIDLTNGDGTIRTRYLNFVYQPSFDERHRVDGILVHAVDVTDQVAARHRAEEIANLNKAITDNTAAGLLIMDLDHVCTFMNPAAEQITGWTFDQLQKQKKPLHEVVHYKHADGSPYPMEDCPTSQALTNKDRIATEDYFVRPDGSMFPVSITSSPIVQDGRIVGIVEEIRDITTEKESEDHIRQLNRDLEKRVAARTEELTLANAELGRSNEELEDFAYVASHDLQEPLRKIAAFSNLLEADYGDVLPPEAHAYLTGLRKSSGRMRTLINDLLTYSRVTTQARPFETVDMNALAVEVLEDLQTRIEETEAMVVMDNLGTIEADPLQMRLLMQNLLSNALKYSKPDVAPEIKVYAHRDGDMVRLYIQDNGIGFDENYLDRIFTIFQRLHGETEYEGTGVGLAIVKKIVDRHSGTITAKSKPDAGATFIVQLPLTHGRTGQHEKDAAN